MVCSPNCEAISSKGNNIRNLNVFESLSLLEEVKTAVLLFPTHLHVRRPRRYITEKDTVVL